MYKLLIATVILFTSNMAAFANTQKTEDIDALFSEWQDASTPGLAIKISEGQNTVYENHFGLASLNKKPK
jgi:hypothetical protein